MRGLNVVGLRRAGMEAETRTKLKRAYKLLYRSRLNTSQALETIRAQLTPDEAVDYLVAFVEASDRGITPSVESEEGESE
jgi:UDP-N-acetylglucosamine acyltransferase